ncbi:hypothetical protein Tco_0198735, partial [Tanacetum coccineum]
TDSTKVWIGEREVAEGEVPLLQLTSGRVVPLAGANDQEDVNIQGAGDDVNEGDGDAAKANQTEQGEHVIDVGGSDVVADDEVIKGRSWYFWDWCTDSSHDLTANATDDEVTSVIKSFMPPPPVLIATIATTITACVTSALVYGSDAGEFQPSIFRDSASPSVVEADIAGLSQPVGTKLSAGSFYVSQDMDPETLQNVYIPKWNVTPPNEAWTETHVQGC